MTKKRENLSAVTTSDASLADSRRIVGDKRRTGVLGWMDTLGGVANPFNTIFFGSSFTDDQRLEILSAQTDEQAEAMLGAMTEDERRKVLALFEARFTAAAAAIESMRAMPECQAAWSAAVALEALAGREHFRATESVGSQAKAFLMLVGALAQCAFNHAARLSNQRENDQHRRRDMRALVATLQKAETLAAKASVGHVLAAHTTRRPVELLQGDETLSRSTSDPSLRQCIDAVRSFRRRAARDAPPAERTNPVTGTVRELEEIWRRAVGTEPATSNPTEDGACESVFVKWACDFLVAVEGYDRRGEHSRDRLVTIVNRAVANNRRVKNK